ncbi:MAG: hypothetical protein GXP55_03500 [Deltaproteobacteria bacterium]|nr:hypothetical protein [Deltaproteobacteria bacterium]
MNRGVGTWTFATLFVVAVVALSPGRAWASPPDLLGFGGRSPGMAGTGVSFSNNYEAVYQNPAGLSRAQRSGISLGLHGAAFRLTIDGASSSLDGSRASTIGITLPLPFGGALEDVFVLGTGFFTPLDVVLRNDVRFPENIQWPVINRSQAVTIMMGLGINLSRWIPGFRIGLGAAALADTQGRLLVQLDEGDRFISQTETQLLASFNPIVGATLDVGKFSLGLVYRAEARADISLNIVTENLPVMLPIITIKALAQYDPHTVAAEVSYHPSDEWLLVANVTYRRWSAWTGYVGGTTASSYLPPAPGFRDTFSPRISAEWTTQRRRTRASLRIGYAYEPSPAPRAHLGDQRNPDGSPHIDRATGAPVQVPLRLLDSGRHLLTAGVGFDFETAVGAHIVFDLYAQLHRLNRRRQDLPAPGGTENMRIGGFIGAFGWTGGLEW